LNESSLEIDYKLIRIFLEVSAGKPFPFRKPSVTLKCIRIERFGAIPVTANKFNFFSEFFVRFGGKYFILPAQRTRRF
jgi:hypothetical protein